MRSTWIDSESSGILSNFTSNFILFWSLWAIGVAFTIMRQLSRIWLTYWILAGYVLMLNVINATSNSRALLTSGFYSTILSVYFLNSLKMSRSFVRFWCDWAYFDSFSIRVMKIVFMSRSGLRVLVVSSNYSRVWRWNSSGKAWMMHSIKYCCAIVSLHITMISKILGSTIVV